MRRRISWIDVAGVFAWTLLLLGCQQDKAIDEAKAAGRDVKSFLPADGLLS
jgi:hypothetical protein